MKKTILALLFIAPILVADPIELPWKREISNSSSGYTDKEAAAKVHYYLQKELKDWEGLCQIAEGKFRSEYSKIECHEYYPECWDCSGTATAYCEVPASF